MPPRIETTRLTLRSFEPDDFEAYYERILSQRAVMRFLSGSGEPRSREEAALTFARFTDPQRDSRDLVWAVTERRTKELIGHAVLQRLDKSELIEVGYALGERWWGAGLATEVSRAVVAFGFETLPLDLIAGIARPENAASRRVLEKTGLTFDGMRRYYGFEVAYYELTRSEHEKTRANSAAGTGRK